MPSSPDETPGSPSPGETPAPESGEAKPAEPPRKTRRAEPTPAPAPEPAPRAEPPNAEAPQPTPAVEAAGAPCHGPVGGPPVRIISGASLTILLSFALNNPHMPAPMALAAAVAAIFIMGRAACCGAQWLAYESDVAFESRDRSPGELVAKLVPWIALGVAIPSAKLVTVAFLVMQRPPHELMTYLTCVMKTFMPTGVLCLVLLPFAWRMVSAGVPFSERDRGVFPLAAGLLLYSLWGMMKILPDSMLPPFQGLLAPFKLIVWALLPVQWPLHCIALAVAAGVLRVWFKCVGGTCYGSFKGGRGQ